MHSSKNMMSENRLVQIVDGINNGTLDYGTVSVKEWLEASLLLLFAGGESHIDIKIMYGGGVYGLHSCVSAVTPPVTSAKVKEPM